MHRQVESIDFLLELDGVTCKAARALNRKKKKKKCVCTPTRKRIRILHSRSPNLNAQASGIDRFFLLELDGVTCKAARALNCSAHFECANASEMLLPPELTHVKQASALADWGTFISI